MQPSRKDSYMSGFYVFIETTFAYNVTLLQVEDFVGAQRKVAVRAADDT